mmetsp:Transcript_4853/g.10482  ORF Transcript_4853/g.10482 Transcript_4853/m.10482 type:complete len:348 (+) Transcript_4853:16-1059(+)
MAGLEASAEDAERVVEELEVLKSIYPDSELRVVLSDGRVVEYSASIKSGPFSAGLNLFIGAGYPSMAPPTLLLDSPSLSGDTQDRLASELQTLWEEMDGEPCVYGWIEHVRVALQELEDARELNEVAAVAAEAEVAEVAAADAAALVAEAAAEAVEATAMGEGTIEAGFDGAYHNQWSQADTGVCDPQRDERSGYAEDAAAAVQITSGVPFTDRKSTFQGHAAYARSKADVATVMNTLLSNNKIARATHNIMAYRYQAEGGVQYSDNDEDGEDGAGSKLAHLLELGGWNDVIVVVSRWYGGIHLGPDRFRHINNAARTVLDDGGFVSSKNTGTGVSASGKAKKGKKR